MSNLLAKWGKYKYFGTLLSFYIVAHGGVLIIPNAIYWDDWIIYQANPEIIMDTFRQAGSIFNLRGYMHNAFLSIGPWFYKVLTFILMFGAGISLDKILKNYKIISAEARFVVVLLFLVLPFYWARVALVDIDYTISYFLFYLAWAIMDKHRIIALILFFLSFHTNSLLVFYLLPFLDYYYRSSSFKFSVKSFFTYCLNKIDFFLAPFIFFAIKNIFYSPYGLYEGYNQQYSYLNLIKSPASMIFNWMQIEVGIIFLLALSFLIYGLLRLLNNFSNISIGKSPFFIFLAGLLFFIFGAFPYWILGHAPVFSDWSSRHQLLLPLGSSFLLFAMINLFKADIRPYVTAIFLSAFLIMNVDNYLNFYFDWQKQKALVSLFAKDNLIKNADLIIFDDKASNLNAANRSYREYEWNALLANAFGEESRFGVRIQEREMLLKGEIFYGYFQEGEKYRANNFDPSKILKTVLVTISPNASRTESIFDKQSLVIINSIQLPDTVLNLKK